MGAANRDAGVCTRACRNARCGDGLKADTEGCDNGAMNVSVAYSPTPPAAGQPRFCRAAGAGAASCTPVPFCGDGTTQTANSEQCDDGADNGKPGKCTAECKRPVVDPVARKIKVASVTPAGCNATCLNDINTSGGDVLVGCTPAAPAMGPPDFRLAGDTSLTFAALGGTAEGVTRLTLFIDGGGSYTVSCDRAGGAVFPLLPQPTQDIPDECAERSGGIKINIHNNGTGTAMTPSCLRLRFAEVDANVRATP